MKKHDFKQLDAERAQLAVSVQEARDLVSKWMGSDFTELDETEAPLPIKILSSTNLGLGADPLKSSPNSNFTAAKPVSSKALQKLQRVQLKNKAKVTKNVRPPLKAPESESESESESKTSKSRTIKRRSALDAYKQNKRKKKH